MKTRIMDVLNHLKSMQLKWLAAVALIAVVVISATFVPLVWAADNKLNSSSKIVTFYDDGVERTIITKAKTVQDALAEAEIRIGNHDKVAPAIDSELSSSMVVVNIRRARPVTVVDDNGRSTRIITADVDKAEIAKKAGMKLKSNDTAEMTTVDDFLSYGGAGQQVSITRAKTVNLMLYGQKLTIRTQKDTIREMIAEIGLKLNPDDTVSLDQGTAIADGMALQIWRNGIQTVEQVENVPFETQVVKDNTKKRGYVEVQTAGQPGQKTVIYQVNMRDGVEVSRQVISEVVTVPAVTQVEVHGTKIELPPGSHTDWMRMAGIPESDFGAANFIISRESGWNPQATNRSSGAYGLPQALPGTKMASAGADWETNPITQLRWFYSYCRGRYGSIQGAYDFWQENHWY